MALNCNHVHKTVFDLYLKVFKQWKHESFFFSSVTNVWVWKKALIHIYYLYNLYLFDLNKFFYYQNIAISIKFSKNLNKLKLEVDIA